MRTDQLDIGCFFQLRLGYYLQPRRLFCLLLGWNFRYLPVYLYMISDAKNIYINKCSDIRKILSIMSNWSDQCDWSRFERSRIKIQDVEILRKLVATIHCLMVLPMVLSSSLFFFMPHTTIGDRYDYISCVIEHQREFLLLRSWERSPLFLHNTTHFFRILNCCLYFFLGISSARDYGKHAPHKNIKAFDEPGKNR